MQDEQNYCFSLLSNMQICDVLVTVIVVVVLTFHSMFCKTASKLTLKTQHWQTPTTFSYSSESNGSLLDVGRMKTSVYQNSASISLLPVLGPVVRKPINANPGLNSNRGFNFVHPNHLHSHNLRINEKKSPIYNPKAKIL